MTPPHSDALGAQEIIDAVYDHLMAQGRRSMFNDRVCGYRGKGGCKDPVGLFITDDEILLKEQTVAMDEVMRASGLPFVEPEKTASKRKRVGGAHG